VTEHGPEVSQRYRPLSRPFLARYGGAAVLALAALIGARLLFPLADAPVYSLLVGAVAVSVWYGGLGPGLLALAIGWSVAPFLLIGEGEAAGLHNEDDLFKWGVPLAVGLIVVWVSVIMRRGQERAATAAVAAEESSREMETLQRLAATLSAAVTPTEVAGALVEMTSVLLGARGGAVGLVEADELVIIDPAGAVSQTHRPGLRMSLRTRAPIAMAAAGEAPVVVHDRAEFLARFPDGAALSPYAQGAIAVPLRIVGGVVGSMSFLFDRPAAVEEDAVSIALIAADLGGQALERARLYDREHQSRRALDRILRVAPRFHAQTPEGVSAAICAEARAAFGSDLAEIWQLAGSSFTLVWREPRNNALPRLDSVQIDALPGLRQAVEDLEVTFVADVERLVGDVVSEYIRQLDIRSWIWVPIVVGGQAERVLLLSWHGAVSEPDASTVVLARRFADQAGLAVEQLDRRRAQEQAARRAERTRRLQEATAALSQAATAADVSSTCLEHALGALGAHAGLVALGRAKTDELELVSARGYSDETLERWRTLTLSSELPVAKAISTGEPVWALTEESAAPYLAAFSDARAQADRSWVAFPLTGGGGIRGAVQLGFRELLELDEEDRAWLEALALQCSQAFERSRLLEEEQRLRRRSERLQSMTASLSGSVTQRDVADVAVSEIREAVGASGAGLAVVLEDRQLTSTLASAGYDHDVAHPLLEASPDAHTPGSRALRRRTTGFYGTLDEIRAEFPEAAAALARTGHASFVFVPLLAGGRATGLVAASWSERTALTAEDRSFLETLAGQVAQALDRARHFESERTIAETLQRSVLPVSLPSVDGVELAARYLPGTAEVDVGGDWFDAISLPNGRLGLAVGDVVGKGVQSAAMMAQLRNALRAFALDQTKPSSTMTRLNRLAQELPESAFATIVYLVVDPVARVCRYTSAGHPPPLAVYPEGRAEFLEGGRSVPVGTAPDTTYTQSVVEVPFATTLVLYTDGLVERRGEAIDSGLERLKAAALTAPRGPERLVEHILAELVGLEERRDDIAILAVRLLAAASQPLHLRLPSTLDSLDIVREALRRWLEQTPTSRTDAQGIVLATWEACANAVEHALDPVEDFFSVDAVLADDAIRVTVIDSGVWSPETERSDRGLGLRLMHSLMSSVDIETGEGGTRIKLEKEIAGASELR
jgi:serine phosphatase RsbU (regulator of sigma subunit)/anti-sigma regulatory factor (Ser/Thr protein kinase)